MSTEFLLGVAFDETIEKLRTKGKISYVTANFHGHPKGKYISLDEPDVSFLSARELEAINETIKRLSSMNNTQIGAYSHLDIPWKVTEDKEMIDYELVLYGDPLTSVREYQ